VACFFILMQKHVVFGRHSDCTVSGVELSIAQAHSHKSKWTKDRQKPKSQKKTGVYSDLTKCVFYVQTSM